MNRHQQRRIDRLDALVLALTARVDALENRGSAVTPAPTKTEVRGTAGVKASRRQDEVKAAASKLPAGAVAKAAEKGEKVGGVGVKRSLWDRDKTEE